MAAIARTAGVAGRTIYARFGDKHGLLKALVTRECARDREFAADLSRRVLHPQVSLLAIGRYWLEHMLSMQRRLLHSDVLSIRDFSLADQLEQSVQVPWRHLFEQLLASGEFGGRIITRISAEQATIAFSHCVLASRTLWQQQSGDDEIDTTATAHTATRNFRAMLGAIDAGIIGLDRTSAEPEGELGRW